VPVETVETNAATQHRAIVGNEVIRGHRLPTGRFGVIVNSVHAAYNNALVQMTDMGYLVEVGGHRYWGSPNELYVRPLRTTDAVTIIAK
jgi:hypothetical protein